MTDLNWVHITSGVHLTHTHIHTQSPCPVSHTFPLALKPVCSVLSAVSPCHSFFGSAPLTLTSSFTLSKFCFSFFVFRSCCHTSQYTHTYGLSPINTSPPSQQGTHPVMVKQRFFKHYGVFVKMGDLGAVSNSKLCTRAGFAGFVHVFVWIWI